MRRKGISPLIAAVLLIAFTMAVASLFAQWAPQLIQNAQGDTAERASEIQDCSGATLSIVGEPTNSEVTVQQKTGEMPVGNVSVTWQFDSNSPAQAYVDINSNRGINTTTAGPGSGTVTEVTASPVACEGSASASWTAS